ncbi:hypothetical protein AAC387_Pa01g1076 [Persea americana]
MWSSHIMFLLKLVCLFALAATVPAKGKGRPGVTYDAKSLIINGKRELIFSGSIHYARSTPQMWPDLIAQAKAGGLNCIQTYTFWNGHEPVEGQYNFEGRYDLVKFIKEVDKQGLYVTLRIGPFIQAEWNHGGLPFWLREVENMTFRTDNEPFKYHMKRYTKKIVSMMQRENLYASQGGPIILTQIENEYDTIMRAFKNKGTSYIHWAGKMAVSLKTGVPWIMCKQKNAPDQVISACNGRHCADTFSGPNGPNKPTLWTENWTQQFTIFGDPLSIRSSEDIAYAVTRFFSKNGSHVNYYMYHGGTNFGRTAAAFVTTVYYDDAPLDEFGFPKEPKYSHLRDVHQALNLCKKALLSGTSSIQNLGKNLEAIIYGKPGSDVCVAFLENIDKRIPATVTFKGTKYYLPARSVSILGDCKTLFFNTHQVSAQHNLRRYQPAEETNKNWEWQMYQEKVPTVEDSTINKDSPIEHNVLAKDTTDYVWFLTTLELDDDDLPWRSDVSPVLEVQSLGHGVVVFVNNAFVGSVYGKKDKQSCYFKDEVPLKTGKNDIALLGMTIGLPDSGVYLEKRFAGVRYLSVKGLNTGTLDMSENLWGHKVGLEGESLRIFTEKGAKKVKWSRAQASQPLTWYKTYFDAPHGDRPIAVDLRGMSKGQLWVNGESIGRYWSSNFHAAHKPTQAMYHVPRSFLKPTNNLLVIFEETGGKPEKIRFTNVDRDTICSYVTEFHPPPIDSWEIKDDKIQAVAEVMKPHSQLKCPEDKVITLVEFASFGDPEGVCGHYTPGKCDYQNSKSVVEKFCLGKNTCKIPIQTETFGGEKCKGTGKGLAIQAKCGEQQKSQKA